MKLDRNKLIKIFILLMLIIIFSMSLVTKPFQNDTFFTIVLGENILKNGIDNKEILTWHEGLEFTNVRWLFNVIIAKIYSIWNFTGIYFFTMCMSALIGCTIFYIFIKKKYNIIFSFFMTSFIMFLRNTKFSCKSSNCIGMAIYN